MGDKFVPVDQQLNSTLDIGTRAFPFALFYDDLAHYFNGFVNWHKQRHIEISILLEGEAEIQVFEQKERLPQGDGFLIFPQNLHTVRMGGMQKTRYFTLIFDPILLYGYQGSFFYEAYYLPYLHHDVPYVLLPQKDEMLASVFADLHWIYQHPPTENPASRLVTSERIKRLWLVLCSHLFSTALPRTPVTTTEEQARITALIHHLHQHAADKFSLTELAAEINVSRGECCRFFKKMLHQTPTEYLMEYRLTKSMEFLDARHLSVTEIAHDVGFSSASYFIAAFHKKLGCTPLAYQKNRQLIRK